MTMFGRQETRVRKAERIAGQAWDQLVDTVDHAGSATRTARRRAANRTDEVSGRMNAAAKEARKRATMAYDALAGRKPSRPWGWLAAAAFVGAVVGWFGTVFGRQMAARSDVRALQESVTDLPTPDRTTVA
jgi:ElaB/YqjD/DUF883 family membrane-anchored ribosome-binding protein